MAISESWNEALALPSDQDSSGRTLGEEEIGLLAEAVRSGTLTSTKGSLVKALEQQFAEILGVKHVVACSSGTSAIHAAIAAINPDPGDEIITTPITDMGALTPILYQGAVPVFADVDPGTFNVTRETIAACLSPRTRAIMATHLFGTPCDMAGIMELAKANHLPVIEDCAQAFLSRHNGHLVGSMGAIGCFSLQQGKHITTGEGGLITSNDPLLARRAFLFVNKAWGYGDPNPDHYFLALNYRMTELQGAVAVAQLPKLEGAVANRIRAAHLLTEALQGVAGIHTPVSEPNCVSTYWKYCLRVDDEIVPGGAVRMGRLLKTKGVSSSPRYIQKPAFECEIFREQRTFGRSHYPFTLARPEALDYDRRRFPGVYEALERILVLPWNERYQESHVTYIAESIRWAAGQCAQEGRDA
jgi:perosamine synthetase